MPAFFLILILIKQCFWQQSMLQQILANLKRSSFWKKLLSFDDDDIVDAAHEALAMLEGDEFDDVYDE